MNGLAPRDAEQLSDLILLNFRVRRRFGEHGQCNRHRNEGCGNQAHRDFDHQHPSSSPKLYFYVSDVSVARTQQAGKKKLHSDKSTRFSGTDCDLRGYRLGDTYVSSGPSVV